jgi:hypothetical protein
MYFLITGAAEFLSSPSPAGCPKNVKVINLDVIRAQKELKKEKRRKIKGTRYPKAENGFLYRKNQV